MATKILLRLLPLVITAILTLFCCGCKTRYVAVPEYHFRDSTKMVYQRDSVFLHDSIYINTETKGDTVYRTKSVTKYIYRDKWRTDTMLVEKRDTITRVVPPERDAQKSDTSWLDYVARCIALLTVGLAVGWIAKSRA